MRLAWKQIAVAFLCGLIAGYAAVCLRPHHRPFGLGKHGEKKYSRMLERLNEKLDLDSGQKEQVAAILEENRKKIEGLRGQFRPQFEGIRKTTNEAIRKLLNPEQQAKFDEMHAKWESRRQKRRRERGEC